MFKLKHFLIKVDYKILLQFRNTRTIKALSLSTGNTLTTIFSLITAISFSRVLSIHDYATYKQIFLIFSFVAPILTLALPDTLFYMLPRELYRKRALIFENFLSLVFLGSIFSIFLATGGADLLSIAFNNKDLKTNLDAFTIYPIFVLPISSLNSLFILNEKIGRLTLFNIGTKFFVFIINIIIAITRV